MSSTSRRGRRPTTCHAYFKPSRARSTRIVRSGQPRMGLEMALVASHVALPFCRSTSSWRGRRAGAPTRLWSPPTQSRPAGRRRRQLRAAACVFGARAIGLRAFVDIRADNADAWRTRPGGAPADPSALQSGHPHCAGPPAAARGLTARRDRGRSPPNLEAWRDIVERVRAPEHRGGRPSRQGCRAQPGPCGPHGHVSLDPRGVRKRDPGNLRSRPRARGPGLHGRRQHERPGGPRPRPDGSAPTSATSTCTRPSASRTAAEDPGMGPIAVAAHLEPFLPDHAVVPLLHDAGREKVSQSFGAVASAPWGSRLRSLSFPGCTSG